MVKRVTKYARSQNVGHYFLHKHPLADQIYLLYFPYCSVNISMQRLIHVVEYLIGRFFKWFFKVLLYCKVIKFRGKS